MIRKVLILLILSTICKGDIYTSHVKPKTDSSLDIGTSSLFWRYIYGDSYTDGTATWTNGSITGLVNVTASGTLTGNYLIGSSLTANYLIYSNTSKSLTSTSINSWISGTSNEIDITDDGDGTATIGIIDPLIVGKGGIGVGTLTDGGILLGSGTLAITALGVATNGQIPIGDGTTDPQLATITGTANQITVTNGAGSIALSTPQDIATDSSPTFTGITVKNINIVAWENECIFYENDIVTSQ